MSTEIRSRIKRIATDCLEWSGSELEFDKKFRDHYEADALDEIEIMVALEEEFSIELPDDNYETLNDFVKQVELQLKA